MPRYSETEYHRSRENDFGNDGYHSKTVVENLVSGLLPNVETTSIWELFLRKDDNTSSPMVLVYVVVVVLIMHY